MTFHFRNFGRSAIPVSALGMGCSPLAGPSWSGETPLGRGAANDAESLRALQCAFDLGVTLVDTADSYGAGHSERVLGKALEGRRDKIFVVTKFGNEFDESTRAMTGRNASPDYIRAACEASLRRLRTDFIDCYMFHWNDFDADKAVEIRAVLDALREDGKIRFFGWSTDYPDRAEAFAQSPGCTAIEHEINVLDDAKPMIDICTAHGLASVNRGPLAMGLLTGKYSANARLPADDVRGKNAPSWMKYFKQGKPNPQWYAGVEAVRDILQSNDRSLAQGALAWLWARSPLTFPIPGFKTIDQVRDNCGALEKGPLKPEQMSEISAILEG